MPRAVCEHGTPNIAPDRPVTLVLKDADSPLLDRKVLRFVVFHWNPDQAAWRINHVDGRHLMLLPAHEMPVTVQSLGSLVGERLAALICPHCGVDKRNSDPLCPTCSSTVLRQLCEIAVKTA